MVPDSIRHDGNRRAHENTAAQWWAGLGQAVLVRGVDSVPRRLQIDQLVLYLGGALWIVLAGSDSSVATAAAVLLMFGAAVDGVLTVARTPLGPRWVAGLTRAAVGLCAAVVLLTITVAARRVLTYAAAGTWALIGIAVTGANDGTTTVTVVSTAAAVVLVGATAVLRLSGKYPAITTS